MNPGARRFLLLAAILGGLAVVLGAFGAHGLRAIIDPALLSVYQTAVQYHFWHALALIGIAFAADRYPGSRLIRASGWAMLAGILLFSGSLYVLSVSGIGRFGMITPVGGLALVAGWGLLVAGLVRPGGNPAR